MDHAAALVDENAHFAALAAAADPETPVPTCPGWSLKQLFRHVGRGDRWAATIVRTGLPADPREVADGRPPEGGLVDWLQGGPQAILDAVAEAGPDTPVWTFNGPRPASWWIRRREHEVLVHRADAALALGADFVVPAERAADSVSEWLGLLEERPFAPADNPLAEGATLHLHATDDGLGPTGEWTIASDTEDGITWSHEHGKGDVALRGPAKELLLAVVRRRTAADAGIEVFGDTAVWDAWLEHTPF